MDSLPRWSSDRKFEKRILFKINNNYKAKQIQKSLFFTTDTHSTHTLSSHTVFLWCAECIFRKFRTRSNKA